MTCRRVAFMAPVLVFVWSCAKLMPVEPVTTPPPPPLAVDSGPALDTVRLVPAATPQITSGGKQSCVLRVDGAIVCWGDWGGIGPTAPVRVPATLDPTGTPVAFAAISFGARLCGLSMSGEAYCQTGIRASIGADSASTPRILVRLATRHRFRVLVSGYGTNCALTPSGQGFCWGDGAAGSLGTGKFGDGYIEASPIAMETSLRFSVLASGGGAVNCGIATTGATYCWGGEKGSVFTTPEMAGACTDTYWQRYQTAPCAVPTAVGGAPVFRSLSTQMQTSCGIALDGHASCWGIGPNGELGNGSGGDGVISIPAVAVSGNLAFATISLGATFACTLTSSGIAYCWGNNFRGFLGSPGASSFAPRLVSGGLTFQSLAAGGTHVCAVSDANEIWCWGGGEYGQLGQDLGTGATDVPIRVSMPPAL